MKQKAGKAIGSILLIWCLLCSVLYAYSLTRSRIVIHVEKLIRETLFMIGIPMVIGIVLLYRNIRKKNKVKLLRGTIWYILVMYIIVLACLLFQGNRGHGNYWFESNLIPFKTIENYIYCLIHQKINTDIIIENVLGNFLLFAPMGLLLPCVHSYMRKWMHFIIIMVVILSGVELLQFITKTGALDIDDFILNFSGACFAYAFTKLRKVKALYKYI